MGKLLDSLAAQTGIFPVQLKRIISDAPLRYKEYSIPKRNGGKRRIAQPSKELKIIQRALCDILLSQLPVHTCAKAYKKEHSIRDNATPHAGHGPIKKYDFADFFPSITDSDWKKYSDEFLQLDNEDYIISRNLLFRKPKGNHLYRLAIGAPSSPPLSNLIMIHFDTVLTEKVEKDSVVYTRYADDLTFSANRTGFLNSVNGHVKSTIKEIPYPTLKLNNSKTTTVTTRYGRKVTGLTLANDGRVTIGRKNKRRIRSIIHHFQNDKLTVDGIEELSGLIAYVNAVEPEYFEKLCNQYGASLIRKILKTKKRRKGKKIVQPEIEIEPPSPY